MKTALIFFKSSEERLSADYIKSVTDVFYNGGISVDVLDVLKSDDDITFRRRLEEYKDTADNVIVFVDDSVPFDVKGIISSVTDTALDVNENAKKFLDAVASANGVSYPDDYAVMPVDATVIPNQKGAMQGFMLEDKEFTLVFLPKAVKELKPMCAEYVIPYFDTKYGKQPYRLCLKYFGEVELVNGTLEEAKRIADGKLSYSVTTKYGDSLISLTFSADTEKSVSADTVRHIVSNHKDNIYAEFDTSLSERLFDILKLKNKKISVAESFTGGRVVSELIKNSGVSNYLNEGMVTYSNDSKRERLSVKQEDLTRFGAVSSQIAYQMALGLLVRNNCDVAIATTGIAGPKSDDTLKPVGLCYFAVGTKAGVHVYKYNLKGDREEITETAKNTALFLAIKNLKNI